MLIKELMQLYPIVRIRFYVLGWIFNCNIVNIDINDHNCVE
jgi:hypothetical protein